MGDQLNKDEILAEERRRTRENGIANQQMLDQSKRQTEILGGIGMLGCCAILIPIAAALAIGAAFIFIVIIALVGLA